MSLKWKDDSGNFLDIGLSSEEDKRMDVFFQPALTWSADSAKGIALFFLENDPSKTDDLGNFIGQDFKKLVKGMLTWGWSIGGNEIGAEATFSKFQNLYNLFLEHPFTHDDLIGFLKKNYVFKIQECIGPETIEGTIFPMFHDLTLKVGPTPHLVDSLKIEDKEKEGSQDIFSGQYLPEATATAIATTSTTTTATETSARKSIFEDYGQLLMRSAIQMAKDHLEEKRELPITFTELLNELIDEEINNLAGMVSRFMMHGVRLEIGTEEKPLYLATGQQFELSNATTLDGDKNPTVSFSFSLEDKNGEAFLEFIPSGTNTFTYTLPLSEKYTANKYPLLALANSFLKLTGDPLPFDEEMVNTLPFYREESRLFALRKWVIWEGAPSDSKSTFQLQIPQSLQFFLQKRNPNPAISIFQIDPSKRPNNLTDVSIDGVKKIEGNTDYDWSTRINISIKRIPKSTGGGYISDTFELAGISEDEINMLESILGNGNTQGVQMHLLFASQGGTSAPTLTSYPNFDKSDEFLLIRNNFSTNNPDSGVTSPIAQAKMDSSEISNFIQLLWEGATIDNGGYYFYLPTHNNTPTSLFQSGNIDKIVLLLEYTSTDGDPIFDFHNNVILKLETDIALDSHLIIAKIEDEIEAGEVVTNEKVPILNIPPGFFGFNFESEMPPETEADFLAQIDDIKILTKIKLREEPNISGTELATINKDENVNPINLSINNNWLLVQSGTKKGWLPETQIIKNPPASNTEYGLNAPTVVYKNPEKTKTEVEGNLLQGAPAQVKQIGTDRIKIKSGATEGWVLKTTEFIETVYSLSSKSAINEAHATRELRNLYQLLGFQIKDGATNKLPIGPTIEEEDSTIWQYERLVAAYKHFSVPAAQSSEVIIPDPEKNPYRGIETGTNSKLDIQFWWQDLYGNKLTAAAPVEKSFEVKYSDPLIGINQWPSVTESFQFVREDQTDPVHLEIELSFSTQGYQNLKPGGATARRLKSDLETFTKIYYQVSQGDISLLVHSSLKEDWEESFQADESNLLTFIVEIYKYLFRLYEYLQQIEDFKKENETDINTAVETKITAELSGLTLEIETKIKSILEAELEAKIIPEIIKSIEEATPANPVDPYEKQFKDRMAIELPAKNALELEGRTTAELNIQLDRKRKVYFDEIFAELVKANISIDAQESIIYDKTNLFSKRINISPEGDNPLIPKKDFIQGLDVSLTISRNPDNIHASLHVDSDATKEIATKYEQVEKSKAILSPKHESSNYTILADQSLRGIQEGTQALFPQLSITVEDLVHWNQDEPGIIKEYVKDPNDDENKVGVFPLLLGEIKSKKEDTFKTISERLAIEINKNTGRVDTNEVELKEDFISNFKLKSDLFKLGITLTLDDNFKDQEPKVGLKQVALLSENFSLQEIVNALPTELSNIVTVEELVEWNKEEINLLLEEISFSLEDLIDLEGTQLAIIQNADAVISSVNDSFDTLFLKVKNALNTEIKNAGLEIPVSILEYSLSDFAKKIKDQKNIFKDYSKLTINESETKKHFIILSEEPSLQGILETLQYDLQDNFTLKNLVDQLWELDEIIKKNVDYHIALIELDKSQINSIETADSVKSEIGDTLNTLASKIKEALITALPIKDEINGVPEPVVNFSLNDFVKHFKDKVGLFKTDARLNIESLNLRNFATNFSKSFPQFHLAVSEERNSPTNTGAANDRSQPGPGKFLFAVHLGATGINYDIEEQDPNFYAIPPLANTLFTGKVLIRNYPFSAIAEPVEKEVNALDMNVLAREFLVAFEDFLKPETLIPAIKLEKETVEKILENKYRLAGRISDTVLPVLAEDNGKIDTIDERLLEAQKAIRHKLRLNLLEGYDIESIVQFQSTITNKTGLTNTDPQPRLTGRAKVLGASLGEDPNHLVTADPKNLDYLITPGYFELSSAGDSSSLTYLFDTKSPEKFGNIHLELEFEPLEIEYNLNKILGEFLASDKLRFILPEKLNVYQFTDAMIEKLKVLDTVKASDKDEFNQLLTKLSVLASDTETYSSLKEIGDKFLTVLVDDDIEFYENHRHKVLTFANPNYMGKSAVPIPLRNYPQPPSLIFQRAESDDSSLTNINDLREWEYKIVYEHQDIAQDSIDCIVKLNTLEETLGANFAIKYKSAAESSSAAQAAAKKAEQERDNSKLAFEAVEAAKVEEAKKRTEAESLTDAKEKIGKLNEARDQATIANTQALVAKNAAEKASIAADEATLAAAATEKLAKVDSDELILAESSTADAKDFAKEAQEWATKAAQAVDNLFDALINFAEILPDLQTHISLLTKDSPTTDDEKDARKAINALYQLSSLIASNWDNVGIYNNASFYTAIDEDLHYEISEEPLPDFKNDEDKMIRARQGTVKWINPNPNPREGIKPLNPLLDLPGFSRKFIPEKIAGEGDENNLVTFEYTEGNSNEFTSESKFETAILAIDDINVDDYNLFRKTILDLAKSTTTPAVYQITDDMIYKLRKTEYIKEVTEANKEVFIQLVDKLEILKEAFAFDPHDYGDSSIPDRVFRIENLDVLQYQNAAASIWLSRNKTLVFDKDTNPAFVFQTPAVRFANSAIPFITNDEPFDIAVIGSADNVTPQTLDFLQHMQNLLELLKPKADAPIENDYRYEARLSCRFAFSLATGKGLNDDLVSTLPLLIGLRLSPGDLLDKNNNSEILTNYPAKLKKEISTWFELNRPIEENAYLLFSLDIFSKLDPDENSSLPMLRVKRLELKLENIKDMEGIRTGNI